MALTVSALFSFVGDPHIALKAEFCEAVLFYKGLCTTLKNVIPFLPPLDPGRELACTSYYLRGHVVLIYALAAYGATAIFRARARSVSYLDVFFVQRNHVAKNFYAGRAA
jgi:hypothetical protein